MKLSNSSSPVVLLGKLGHGKTNLVNRLCGTNFPSAMTARSCTTTISAAFMRATGYPIIDTPGFGSARDIAAHLAAQKVALEGRNVAGVYVVAKYGRADEIAEMVDKIMGFTGEEDLRIIITHSDIAKDQPGYDEDELTSELSSLLDIPNRHIIVVGKNTTGISIEEFIMKTRHHPRRFTVGDEQLAMVSKISVGPRKINKAIDEVYAKIEAASKECEMLIRKGKTDATDLCIITNQKAATDMVQSAKENIFRDADSMSEDQQNIVYGKAGVALSLRLREFITATNKCLTWDVTDPDNKNNLYRACNHCGAVYNKTEGCDDETICGDIPRDQMKDYSGVPKFNSFFYGSGKSWKIRYKYGFREVEGDEILSSIAIRKIQRKPSCSTRVKRIGATIESGCGNEICWRTMIPVDAGVLGEVKTSHIECRSDAELYSKLKFDEKLRIHQEKNSMILAKELIV